MPRKARIVVPGLAHHITQRGNYQSYIFTREADYRKYCYWYRKYAWKYKVQTLAYCLMGNHVHFIVVPEEQNSLARLFNTVHMRYSQYKNLESKRKGHLWQGRFFSCILSQGHLYRAARYVEMNPVRARMVRYPWDYTWSSTRQHLRLEKTPIIPTTNTQSVLAVYQRTKDWKEYLLEEDPEMEKEIRRKTYKGLALGEESFIIKLEKKFGCRLREKKMGRPKKVGAVP